MAVLDDIGAALVTAGVANLTGPWKLNLGYLQDAPDTAICVVPSGGRAPEQRWAVDYPLFNVTIRGAPDGYQAARQKAQDVFEALHANEDALGPAYVYCYSAQSAPLPGGQDAKRRPYMSFKFFAMKSRPLVPGGLNFSLASNSMYLGAI